MGRAIAVRADYTAGEVRRLAKQAKDGAQARRLLAIAAVLDGASRTEAAKIVWGTRVSPSTVSDLNKKIYGTIEAWRNRPIQGEHPYVYLDGIVLKRSWAGEVRNVSLLVAIGVNGEGYREILGICEGAKEDKAGWSAFIKHLKERGLKGSSSSSLTPAWG
jgi:transposase-like protein